MRRRSWLAPISTLIALFATACISDSSGPGGPPPPPGGADVVVLSRLSPSVQEFHTDGQTVASTGVSVSLPSGFDGVALDLSLDLFVTTSTGDGVGRVIWGSLDTGEMITTGFPGASVADPGRPTLVIDLGGNVAALVPARARNSIYVSFPGVQQATLLAADAGEYVQRVVPFGNLLISIDANLDDVGGSLEPLGATRIQYSEFLSGVFFDAFDIQGAVGATDVVILGEQLLVLTEGSLDNGGLPEGNGNLALINALGRGVVSVLPLEGNGVAIKGGGDGLAYVTRTRGAGTFASDVLSFSLVNNMWVHGPSNPIRPKNADGSDLDTCRATSALVSGRLLCTTFDVDAPSSPGRLVLMQADGTFIDDVATGAGAIDIAIR